MFDYLPQEVIAHILLRLPVKTLGLCLCVCKLWHAIISGTIFINNHIAHTNKKENSGHRLLLRQFIDVQHRELYSLHFDTHPFQKYKDLSFPIQTIDRRFRIVGSCNGILCLSSNGHPPDFVLWNPTIQKFVSLPRPLVYLSYCNIKMFTLGFGFDSLSNDYKVVMLFFLKAKRGHDCAYPPPQVNLYSLSTRSWREISAMACPYKMDRYCWTQVFLNGAIHWVASTKINGVKDGPCSNLILRFNVSDEVFDHMCLPGSLVDNKAFKLSVLVLGGQLSVVQWNTFENCGTCSIWSMKEYGAKESWTKQFEIGSLEALDISCVVNILRLRENSQLLLEMCNGWLFSYDPQDKKVTDLQINGSEKTFYLDFFEESLVLLGQGNENLKEQQDVQSKKRMRPEDRIKNVEW
ncbi:F-box protein CPR30-like [Tripterygium wilfordii]|uniref:F-box protein CPR30-like n=1 Tax=Tripterygium wilfordii TaxID=458696 RepID=A0A7J7BUV9_TRIWF|nr:F-box protein CPR1-like [Tripterygium wilfordii]KAF5725618.1 F-box protein CPR30-like [Tripterygium wilfordii]